MPAGALAGMPVVTLTEIARMRFEAISFFGVVFLLSAWAVQRLWNGLRRDFARLPRLTYRKALTLTALWGLLFLLVLSMISGARELMTPGAWERKPGGLTYTLAGEPRTSDPPRPAMPAESSRRAGLERLGVLLWTYANAHGGAFPIEAEAPEIPADAWRVPGPSGERYRYIGGQTLDTRKTAIRPLAFEPALFGPEQLVLLNTGEIVPLTRDQLGDALDLPGTP
jgi:hypothetical protein